MCIKVSMAIHLSKEAPPGVFHNCSYINNAPPETCNYLPRGLLIVLKGNKEMGERMFREYIHFISPLFYTAKER